MAVQAGYHTPRMRGAYGPPDSASSGGLHARRWQLRTGMLLVGGILAITDACVMSAIYLLAVFSSQKEVLVSMNAVGEFWFELPLVLLAVPMVMYLAVSGLMLGIHARDAGAEGEMNLDAGTWIPTMNGTPVQGGYGANPYEMVRVRQAAQSAQAYRGAPTELRPVRQPTVTLAGNLATGAGAPVLLARDPDAHPPTVEVVPGDNRRGF